MFSIVMSAFFSISLTISSPRGDLRLSVRDFLLALNWWKYQGSSSGWPGRSRRPGSPVFGFSILTTSAPSQASASVQDGPASNWVKSTTRTPSRQSSATPSIAAIARHSSQKFRAYYSAPDRAAETGFGRARQIAAKCPLFGKGRRERAPPATLTRRPQQRRANELGWAHGRARGKTVAGGAAGGGQAGGARPAQDLSRGGARASARPMRCCNRPRPSGARGSMS